MFGQMPYAHLKDGQLVKVIRQRGGTFVVGYDETHRKIKKGEIIEFTTPVYKAVLSQDLILE